MATEFTPKNPPKTGKARALWDWWIEHRGEPPDALWVMRPGRHQRAAGACHYSIDAHHTTYLIYDPDRTLEITPDDAVRAGQCMIGHMYLE